MVALEVNPSREASVSTWQAERSAQAARGDLTLVVGHLDLLGVPV